MTDTARHPVANKGAHSVARCSILDASQGTLKHRPLVECWMLSGGPMPHFTARAIYFSFSFYVTGITCSPNDVDRVFVRAAASVRLVGIRFNDHGSSFLGGGCVNSRL